MTHLNSIIHLIFLILLFAITAYTQEKSTESWKKHHVGHTFLFHSMNYNTVNVESTGGGSLLGSKNQSRSYGFGINYSYSFSRNHSLQVGLYKIYNLSTSETFSIYSYRIFNLNSVFVTFSGLDNYGVSLDAGKIMTTYQYHFLKTNRFNISLGMGPGLLYWDPEYDNNLIFKPPEFLWIIYGHLTLNSPGIHWFGIASSQFRIRLFSEIHLNFHVNYLHFFQPVYQVDRLYLKNGAQMESEYSYQKKVSSFQLQVGMQFGIF